MGNLLTPKSVQKLQAALHAKAKAEAGYRFYALYDKISREDILAHAYAQCRANKGAAGVDGQDFADIEAYGVQRWLGELALALKREAYRPEPIRRVFIPKANGKLRPLGISTVRDRVCMTAAMLVLEPIFEADRYCEPLRHPSAPGLSLTGVRLIIPDHAVGLPVLRALSLCTCCRHYPGAATRCLSSAHSPCRISLPRKPGRVGPTDNRCPSPKP